MTDMREAIANQIANQTRRDEPPFEPSPDLEDLGRRLDQLKDDNPDEYHAAGLRRVRQQVTLYRRRKALHEENNR